jgi:translation initiation factor 4B
MCGSYLGLMRGIAKDRPEQKDMSDWTRKGPLADLPGRRAPERSGGFGRNFDAPSEAGSDGGSRRRPPPFEGDGKVRDFGNWERRGPLSPASAGPTREGGRPGNQEGPPRERRQSPAWGEGRSQDGSRPPRREFQDRPQFDRQPTAPELDNQWRTKMRPDAAAKSPTATPDASTPSSPAPQPAAPATRPRLNLSKRTVSDSDPAPASSTDAKSNPFGAAKPIDTATREREIEEKRQLAIRQKKEADDKVREDRKAKEAAERKEKAAAAPPTPTIEKTAEKTEKTSEEGDEKKSARNLDVLQGVGEDSTVEGEGEDEDGVDASANGNIVEDKETKPKEVVRDPPKADQGSWRRKSSTPSGPAESTTEKLEDDGWSTVAAKTNKNKGRGTAPRAIAS